MAEFDFETALILMNLALEKAKTDYKRPICVAICDQYGFLMCFSKMDGAPVRSIAISQGKAYTAARMGVNTASFLERLHRENVPASYFCDEQLTGLPGGAVLKNKQGIVIGATGISGLTPEEDQAIADAMSEALARRL